MEYLREQGYTVFPTRGMRAEATYNRAVESLGSDVNYTRVFGRLNYAFSLGKNIVIPGFEVSATLDGSTTLYSAYPLGGFLRLSGLGNNELFGRSGGLARVIYYRNLWTVGLGVLRTPLYAGISLESGNVYQEGEKLTWDSLRRLADDLALERAVEFLAVREDHEEPRLVDRHSLDDLEAGEHGFVQNRRIGAALLRAGQPEGNAPGSRPSPGPPGRDLAGRRATLRP